MKTFSLMSGTNFMGGAYGHDWIMAWASIFILGLLVFFIYMAQKNDIEFPFPFNWAGALLGVLGAFITITFTGSGKIGLLVGVILLAVGGYFVGRMQGG